MFSFKIFRLLKSTVYLDHSLLQHTANWLRSAGLGVLVMYESISYVDCLDPPPVCHIKDGGIPLGILPKDITSKLFGFFSNTMLFVLSAN